MHKDLTKMNWKAVMRKIKQYWDDSSVDEISQLQRKYEDQEKQLYKQHKYHSLHSKMLKINKSS